MKNADTNVDKKFFSIAQGEPDFYMLMAAEAPIVTLTLLGFSETSCSNLAKWT